MSLLLPDKYPFLPSLSAEGISIVAGSDVPAIRIGILNLMPEAEKYETSILRRIGCHNETIVPVFIRSAIHGYSSSDKNHLRNFYQTFDEALNDPPDGLIITGAPVEKIDYSEVRYWPEISEILNYSRTNFKGTMGLCWGGMAMAKLLGIGKTVHEKKIFGVFPSINLHLDHPVTGSKEKIFYCPQSRYAGFDEEDLKAAEAEGKADRLAFSEETGHFIFSAHDENFIGHIGHPEYTVERILFEYHRDRKAGLNNFPRHFDPDHPEYSWKDSGTAFFIRWIDRIISDRSGSQK